MLPDKWIKRMRVPPGGDFRLKDHDPGWAPAEELKDVGQVIIKEEARQMLARNVQELAEAQDLLYADHTHAVLVVLQAMDAAGKDGTIKHVMSGLNPQGVQVFSFKRPSTEELDHTFLWRCMKCLPERGKLGIFNRSYYEDVLVVKVHPDLLDHQRLPAGKRGKSFWQHRYDDINAFEKHLVRNGTVVLKFFLNVSKDEQKKRFLERLDNSQKHWKFTPSDIAERAYWDAYMQAYEQALSATSTKWAPWYVVPADHKWVTRVAVADLLSSSIRALSLKYPVVPQDQREILAKAKDQLERE
jgi:PPK2 family polyphosphate:nucleotide phosphotransferase